MILDGRLNVSELSVDQIKDLFVGVYNQAIDDSVEAMSRDQEVNYDPMTILKLKI